MSHVFLASYRWRRMLPGPAIMVTAAFIGPGTVTVCMQAGMIFRYELLWALTFSVIATIILQEMAARLGLVTQQGLGSAIVSSISLPVIRAAVGLLLGLSILMGNAAFEAGNLTGTALGLQIMTGTDTAYIYYHIGIPALLVAILLWKGSYQRISLLFTLLVACMSLAFLVACLATGPDLGAIVKRIVIPVVPADSLMIIVGLIGTTVVPYNLFMHASFVKNKWHTISDLPALRWDIYWAIGLGGIISASILITGASIFGQDASSVSTYVQSLSPVFGKAGVWMFGLGYFAAGLTSAITAPVAAAMVAREVMNWPDDVRHSGYRAVWITVLLSGVLFSSLGYKPIHIISLAQFANGILLPFIACFLLWAVNRPDIMKDHKNTRLQNVLAILVILVSIILGWKGVSTGLVSLLAQF